MRAEKKDRAEADCRDEELGRKQGGTRGGEVARSKMREEEREKEKGKERGVSVGREGLLKALKRVLVEYSFHGGS